MAFVPRTLQFEDRVRRSFEQQILMRTLGVTLEAVEPGHITLSMPFAMQLTQQHGFIHAGIITTALDSACGYAAFSLMDEESEVLTAEFKTNLLAPAKGSTFVFKAEVVKPGRTLTFSEGKAYALNDNEEDRLIATMSATLMAVRGRSGVNT